MTSALAPVTLAGHHVRLEPLSLAHHAALCAAGADPDTFRWFPTTVAGDAAMRAFIELALSEQLAGRALPFVIRRQSDGEIVGSTRFGAVELAHARGEIGATWLHAGARRSAINTECKLLLLRHGFEVLNFNRIELKTDALNSISRVAIARLGATPEGIFRQHMVTSTGRVRDTAWFSIVKSEWPAVCERLQQKLAYCPSTSPSSTAQV